MSSVNKVIIVGRVGKDPEVRYLPNGGSIAGMSVATSFKDKNGQEITEWHRCSVFGKLSDIVAQWVKRGSLVYLEGRLQTRKWTDKNGQDRYTTEIVVQQMQMLGGKAEGGQPPRPAHPAPQAAPSAPSFDSDIPF